MKDFTPYFNFDGNCREAMNFYAKCFDCKPEFMTFEDSKQSDAKETAHLIMHSTLSHRGKPILMASDCPPGMPFVKGTNVSISIACDSAAEVDSLFASLGVKGNPLLKPEKMFWGSYFGMVIDQYGMHWLFGYDEPTK